VLVKPFGCGRFRQRKLAEIGIEVATRYQGEPFRLQRTLISCKCQVGGRQPVVARTSSNGVGETRVIQLPGSYMRAARVERIVMSFSQTPPE
jgi:hypothetical protein